MSCIKPIYLLAQPRGLSSGGGIKVTSARACIGLDRAKKFVIANPSYRIYEMSLLDKPVRKRNIEQELERERKGSYNDPIDLSSPFINM